MSVSWDINAVEASDQMWACRNRAQNCTGNWKCVVEVVVTLAVLHPLVRGKESMVLLKVDNLWMCS